MPILSFCPTIGIFLFVDTCYYMTSSKRVVKRAAGTMVIGSFLKTLRNILHEKQSFCIAILSSFSAPPRIKEVTMLSPSYRVAVDKAVGSSSLFSFPKSAQCSIRSLTKSSPLLPAAMRIGVSPSLFLASTPAPRRIKIFTRGLSQFLVTCKSGASPFSSLT